MEEGIGGRVANIIGLLKSHMETYKWTIALYLDLVHALRSKLTPLPGYWCFSLSRKDSAVTNASLMIRKHTP